MQVLVISSSFQGLSTYPSAEAVRDQDPGFPVIVTKPLALVVSVKLLPDSSLAETWAPGMIGPLADPSWFATLFTAPRCTT